MSPEVQQFAAAVRRLARLADDLNQRPHVRAIQTRRAPDLETRPTPTPALRQVCRCGRGAVQLVAVDLPDTLPAEMPADRPAAVLICPACDDGGWWRVWPMSTFPPHAERAHALAHAAAILSGATKENDR